VGEKIIVSCGGFRGRPAQPKNVTHHILFFAENDVIDRVAVFFAAEERFLVIRVGWAGDGSFGAVVTKRRAWLAPSFPILLPFRTVAAPHQRWRCGPQVVQAKPSAP
jgi:hypothetical protein